MVKQEGSELYKAPSLPALPFPFQSTSSYFMLAGAALLATPGVERAALSAAIVHRACEPVGYKRAHDEYRGQKGKTQSRLHQPSYFSRSC
jgi:hypothetical protein